MADPSTCCLRSSLWEGTPSGTETTLPGVPNPTYIAQPLPNQTADTGPSAPRVAILYIPDLFGWSFRNARLLADAYAREANATVYLPDFYGGEVVPLEAALAGRWEEIDLAGFTARNARAIREPEIVAFARALREKYDRVAAVGFCYGGWAVHRLGAAEFNAGEERLVDCISAGHPTWLTEKDIEEVAVPVQMLAPEVDHMYTPELRLFSFQALQKKGLPFDYQHFPGVEHGCLTKGGSKEGEKEAMARGKNAAVAWFRQWLHDQ